MTRSKIVAVEGGMEWLNIKVRCEKEKIEFNEFGL